LARLIEAKMPDNAVIQRVVRRAGPASSAFVRPMRFFTKIFAVVSFASWQAAVFAQPTPSNRGGAGEDGGITSGASAVLATPDGGIPMDPEPSLSEQMDAAAGKPVPATGAPPSATAVQTGSRGFFQSLNPDIAVILDGAIGFSQRAPLILAGDDPDLGGGASDHSAGITLQELELAFQSIVDPYFRADVFLTIPNMAGLEIEEAFLTTTSLPEVQVKAGIFRSAFGRQNGMHLHVQDFVERPLINAAYLGTDGLRPPGVQVSWMLPLPVFLQLTGEVFSVAPPNLPANPVFQPLYSFGGGRRTDLTYAGELKLFIPTSESLSVLGGLNVATGSTPGLVEAEVTRYRGARSMLYGADLYIKYKPPNEAVTYFSLAWTTEYFLRTIGAAQGDNRLTDGGFYTQLVVQMARRWFVGIRQDLLCVPSSDFQPLTSRTALDLTFYPSEFSKLRGSVQYDAVESQAPRIQQLSLSPVNSFAAFLQFEVSIGAHGAHKF